MDKYISICKRCSAKMPNTTDIDNAWFREYCLTCITELEEERIRQEFDEEVEAHVHLDPYLMDCVECHTQLNTLGDKLYIGGLN